SIHRGCEPCRAGADDDRVVLAGGRARLEADELGDLPKVWPYDGRAVGATHRGEIAVWWQRASPAFRGVRIIRCEPFERDLVAVEETAQLRAGRVQAAPHDDGARLRRLGGNVLKPAHALPRERADPDRDFGRRRGNR